MHLLRLSCSETEDQQVRIFQKKAIKIWKLNSMILNGQWIREEIKEEYFF